jgi:hypothetical protein
MRIVTAPYYLRNRTEVIDFFTLNGIQKLKVKGVVDLLPKLFPVESQWPAKSEPYDTP